jgi:ASC-1-like (ASCH) protein
MATHELKTWSEPFEAIWDDRKFAEFRADDRTPRYKAGDRLFLKEWDHEMEGYMGRTIEARVTDVRSGGAFGIPEGYAMLSIRVLNRYPKDV